jgi:XTP/dITP diphosphohydrolase
MRKLIHHPHIYSDTVVKDEEEVNKMGKAQIKEGKSRGVQKFANRYKASRIQEKVKELALTGMNHIKYGRRYKKS